MCSLCVTLTEVPSWPRAADLGLRWHGVQEEQQQFYKTHRKMKLNTIADHFGVDLWPKDTLKRAI